MRFESVQCLPVWSFNGPSRPTGYVLVRYANLYWLVTVSGFQGSSCSGFPTYPAVLPAACYLTRVKRQGDTLLIRTTRVNNFSEHFFDHLAAGVLTQIRESKTPPDLLGRRSQDSMSTALPRRFCCYVIVSERLSVFNTRSGLLLAPAVRQRRLPPDRTRRKSISAARRRYPRFGAPRLAVRRRDAG
jgi:hypothetical protein